MVVVMAYTRGGVDEACDNTVMDPALGMRIDGNVVMFLSQPPQKLQRSGGVGGDKVLLIDRIQMRIARQQIPGPVPADEDVNRSVGKVGTQFVQQRCGE